MNDLEDAEARVRSAEVMHRQLCAAYDRGEPVKFLLKSAHAEMVAAKFWLGEVLAAHGAVAPGDVA